MVRLAVLALAALLAAPGILRAQSPVTEHVVVTGSTAPVPFAETGRNVFVITREQIARLPVRSVDELLAYLASVDVRESKALDPWVLHHRFGAMTVNGLETSVACLAGFISARNLTAKT